MRFFANGPDIPSDLLYARDKGEVLFFCGAGISIEKAGGVSFLELAKRVISSLGSLASSPAQQLLKIFDKIEIPQGIGGIPPADRIFALLEQEFAIKDIRSDVSQAVKPKSNPCLGPHKSLLNLSRMPDGRHRLITTNFDRLFQLAAPDIPKILPPNLPDPRRDEWEGVVHLHGMVNPDYSGVASKEFILSSADFGRAYLSDGWATAFMRALVEKYKIVFVGYSADDPPIQYLLEGLKGSAKARGLYVFQKGEEEEASALWRHKGVTAIPHQGFPSLWKSLNAWGDRAKDPDKWQQSIISNIELKKPRDLDPHERGQVAHVVSSISGAKKFAGCKTTPSAEWLCVFDSSIRYNENILEEDVSQSKIFLPFCLDYDRPPIEKKNQFNSIKEKVDYNFSRDEHFRTAWSAFKDTPDDKQKQTISLIKDNTLPERLKILVKWIGLVVDQPITVWWASHQKILHHELVKEIEENIKTKNGDPKQNIDMNIITAWFLLLSYKSESSLYIAKKKLYDLATPIQDWSRWFDRQLEDINRPHIKVKSLPKIPEPNTIDIHKILDLNIFYPNDFLGREIPKNCLASYVNKIRQYLESIENLEIEIRGSFNPTLGPINIPTDPAVVNSRDSTGLSRLIKHYAEQLETLCRQDQKIAHCEWKKWPDPEDKIFRILYVWLVGKTDLISTKEAENIILNLSNKIFWDKEIQYDLLVSLSKRWEQFDKKTKEIIKNNILEGPSAELEKNKQRAILNRLEWFKTKRLDFSDELSKKYEDLSKTIQDWTPEKAKNDICFSYPLCSENLDISEIYRIPINKILKNLVEISNRNGPFFWGDSPFEKLSEKYPIKSLRVLMYEANHGNNCINEWSLYLNGGKNYKNKLRLIFLIAKRIYFLPELVFNDNIESISSWVKKNNKILSKNLTKTYLALWKRIVKSAITSPIEVEKKDRKQAVRQSTIIEMTKLLIDELLSEKLPSNSRTRKRLKRANYLLSTKDDLLFCVMDLFGKNLNSIYSLHKKWINKQIISRIEQNPDSEASKAFILSALKNCYKRKPHLFEPNLFVCLKKIIINLVLQKNYENNDTVMWYLLTAWIYKERNRLLTNEELHEILIKTNNQGRLSTIDFITKWAIEQQKWEEVTEFLSQVWPRQLVARTPDISKKLILLAISAGNKMPEITQQILPKLTVIKNFYDNPIFHSILGRNPILDSNKDLPITQEFLEETLNILETVMPNDIEPPYIISKSINELKLLINN